MKRNIESIVILLLMSSGMSADAICKINKKAFDRKSKSIIMQGKHEKRRIYLPIFIWEKISGIPDYSFDEDGFFIYELVQLCYFDVVEIACRWGEKLWGHKCKIDDFRKCFYAFFSKIGMNDEQIREIIKYTCFFPIKKTDLARIENSYKNGIRIMEAWFNDRQRI